MGSRTAAVVGIAGKIEEAEAAAEKACSSVTGRLFHRKDIGTTELINRRIAHMNALKG